MKLIVYKPLKRVLNIDDSYRRVIFSLLELKLQTNFKSDGILIYLR